VNALSYEEAQDFYDAIEWAAAQPWSNGKVGLYGISYYAMSQYWGAGLNPPHLKAIVPWEGLADPYRDIGYRGGIPTVFAVVFATGLRLFGNRWKASFDFLKLLGEHPLCDYLWQYGTGALADSETTTPWILDGYSDIEVPMLSVGSLDDPDMHLRGNVTVFMIARSPHKKLLLYTGTHWGSAFQPWGNRTVLRFLDHWLKGVDTGIEDEPVVDVQLRTGSGPFTHIYGDAWPLPQTQWTRYHLDAKSKRLSITEPQEEGSVSTKFNIDTESMLIAKQVTFLTEPLKEDTAIAGPVNAHLWVSSSRRDADLVIEIRDYDPAGHQTRFGFIFAGSPDTPVTRGWLRASLRAIDPERSLPHRPFYPFDHNDWLTPGVPVALDIETWPTAMLFKAGHRIGLTVYSGPHLNIKWIVFQGICQFSGKVKIHTGGEYPSWLELPLIPADLTNTNHIKIHDGHFMPALVVGQMGDRFEWTNAGADYYSVTESSGLDLWDSQLIRGMRSHNPETWWTRIPWAGTFDYRDQVSGFEGAIAIPVHISGPDPKKGRVEVELATEPPPHGVAFDVQLQAGDGKWSTVHEGVRDAGSTLELSPGMYSMRSRLRSLDTDKPGMHTGWSPPSTFLVK
jgi:predicted acyl esterase